MNYRFVDYLAMVADEQRTGAYARALRRLVTPESIVLDLGAGFGFFAILAARLGARHAYAIEPNDVVAFGPALARANGVADRVTFFRGDSRKVQLPERATLLVEDLRSVLPLQDNRFALLRDARERLLTADAQSVALRDRLWAAPARHPASYRHLIDAAGPNTCGVDLRPLRALLADDVWTKNTGAGDLLLPGALVGEFDLLSDLDAGFDGTARWTCSEALAADGFAVWFDAELAGGERFSSAPGPDQTVHRCLYLPLRETLAIPGGVDLTFRFCGIHAGERYSWAWESALADVAGNVLRRTPRQSSLFASALTPMTLRSLSEQHRPVLGPEGQRWRAADHLVDGTRSSHEIADALAAAPSNGFDSAAEALNWLTQALRLLESGVVEQL